MAEKLGEALLEIRTADRGFEAGVEKAEGRARQLGATLDMTAGSALEMAEKMAVAGRTGGESAAVWQRAAASIDALAAAQVQAKTETSLADAALKAGKISQEEYQRTLLLTRAALQGVEEEHRQAQAELKRTIAATSQANVATGAQRAGLQQLGFQLGDISTMYALGMRPQQIFASQVGQVAQAIQLTAGEGSKFARFLTGPWGIALIVAVQVLGPFVGLLFDAKKAMEDVEMASSGLADAQGVMGQMFDLTTGKIKSQNEMLRLNAQLMAINLRAQAAAEKANADKAMGSFATGRIGLSMGEKAMGALGIPVGGSMARESQVRQLVSDFRAGKLSPVDAARRAEGLDFTGLAVSKDEFLKAVADGVSYPEKQKVAAAIEKSLADGALDPSLREDGKAARGRKSRSSKAQADIEQAYLRDIAALNQEELQARMALATSAQERADIQYQMLADQRVQREAEIRASKDYSAAQKQHLLDMLDTLYGKRSADGSILASGGLLKERIARDQSEAERRMASDMAARQVQVLDAWARVADTARDRAILEAGALELQQQIERNLLEQQIATGQIADAAQARALLDSRQAAEREGQRLASAGPLDRYADQLRRNKLESGERVEELMVEELDYVHQSLTDTIAARLGVRDPLLRGLIAMFIEDLFIAPMAEALRGARSRGGGLFGAVFGTLLGGAAPQARLASSVTQTLGDPQFAGLFANGGTIPAGAWGIAGENGPEPVFAGTGGAVVLPHSSVGGSGGRGAARILQFDMRGAVMTEDLLQQMQAIASETTRSGLAGYDEFVSDRVQEQLERRGS
jgi:hypothetical protein